MSKGIVDVQVNWLFTLIAGAIILLVVYMFIQHQQEAAEASLAERLSTDLETIAIGAGAARGTAQVIQIPDMQIEFTCTHDCGCGMRVGSVERPFKEKIIFAPPAIQGYEMLLWSLDWNVPFRVNNFLFMTNQNHIYYFVTDDVTEQLASEIIQRLPDLLNYQIISSAELGSIETEGFDSVNIIFLNTEIPPGLGLFTDYIENVKGLGIFGTESYGDLQFFIPTKSGSFMQRQLDYVSYAAMFGAIFSADDLQYSCNMKAAFNRLATVATVYSSRIGKIEEITINGKRVCPRSYTGTSTSANSILIELIENAYKIKKSGDFQQRIIPQIEALENENQAFLLKNCPYIY